MVQIQSDLNDEANFPANSCKMSRNLYDPARDTFTSSEDAAAVDLNKSDEQSSTPTPQVHGHNTDAMDKHGSKVNHSKSLWTTASST